MARLARARFSATLVGSSCVPSPQFNDRYMPSLTPPLRVKKPWPIMALCWEKTGSVTGEGVWDMEYRRLELRCGG
jgi:hypothetical protein